MELYSIDITTIVEEGGDTIESSSDDIHNLITTIRMNEKGDLAVAGSSQLDFSIYGTSIKSYRQQQWNIELAKVKRGTGGLQ